MEHIADETIIFKITDMENRLMDMGRGKERVRCMDRVTWKLTLPGNSSWFSVSI